VPGQATARRGAGSRPANRRALISAAARDLFSERGFDQVGLGEIAEAVDVGASAIYRHFKNKQDLLKDVLLEGISPLNAVLDGSSTDLAAVVPRLAAATLDNRPVGILLQRDARHLPDTDSAEIRAQLRQLTGRLAELILLARPGQPGTVADLLASSAMAALCSVAFHHVDRPRPGYDKLLAELVMTVLYTDLDPALGTMSPPPAPTGVQLIPASRREALLERALPLFVRRGYANVSMEDIGAEVGIAGPSLYNHFSTKQDILTIALQRGSAMLYMDLAYILRTADHPADALARLVNSYVTFSREHPDIVDVMITQLGHLPEDRRRELRGLQHEYVTEWVQLLCAATGAANAGDARLRVHAALTIANNAALSATARGADDVPNALNQICAGVLGTAR
jgi:AcrR family transcriptional regulator